MIHRPEKSKRVQLPRGAFLKNHRKGYLMTTKAQEREALEKIVSILGTLETDSYVNTAFAGCVEDARENIENDSALSWQDRALYFERRFREEYDARELAYTERDAAKDAAGKAGLENAEAQKRVAALEKDGKRLESELSETRLVLETTAEELRAAHDEIIRLKARLFDLLCAEG